MADNAQQLIAQWRIRLNGLVAGRGFEGLTSGKRPSLEERFAKWSTVLGLFKNDNEELYELCEYNGINGDVLLRTGMDLSVDPKTTRLCGADLKTLDDCLLVVRKLELKVQQSPAEGRHARAAATLEILANRLITAPPIDDNGRGEWLYEQREGQKKTWAAIFEQYKSIRSERGWPKVTTANALRVATERYAKARKLPLSPGKGGRPKRPK